jgi:hypothetical protein
MNSDEKFHGPTEGCHVRLLYPLTKAHQEGMVSPGGFALPPAGGFVIQKLVGLVLCLYKVHMFAYSKKMNKTNFILLFLLRC